VYDAHDVCVRALEDFADLPALEAASVVGLDLDQHPVSVHGGTYRVTPERDRRVGHVRDHDGAAAPSDAHRTRHEAEASGETDAPLTSAHGLAAADEFVYGFL
jgi:hypothetical protein